MNLFSWSYSGRTTTENSYSVNSREYSDPLVPSSVFSSTDFAKETTQAASYNVSSSKYANKNQGINSGKNTNVHKSKNTREGSQHIQQNVGHKEEQKDIIDDLLERIKIKEDKIKQQEKEITTLKQTNNYVNRRSDELTREMAKRTENGRHFENSTDRFSCSESCKRLNDLHIDWAHCANS